MATQNAIGSDKPIEVAFGGTGAPSLTDGGVLLGSDTSAVTALGVATNGQLVIGSTAADPVIASVGSTDGSLTITEGAGTLVIEGTDATEAQDGVVELATDAESIAGSDSVRAIVPTSLKAKLGTQTDHGVLVGAGTAAAVTALAVGTNGQVLLGSTTADPVFATLTSSGATITFTTGAGTLNLEAVSGGGAPALTINAQTGTSYTLVLADDGKLVTLDNAAAIALTVPPNASQAFDIGTQILFAQKGVGKVTFGEGSGVTLSAESSAFETVNQFSVSSIVKVDTDTWYLHGGIKTHVPAWTTRTSSFAGTAIYSIHYDGSTNWLATGDSAKIATATDPTGTWTQRTSDFAGQLVQDGAYDGSATWVIVGNSGKLSTATDPTSTWTARASGFGSSIIYGVHHDGSATWVIVGAAGKLSTATDPTSTWTARTSGFGATDIFDVSYDGTTWVAVGDGGTLTTATDPTGTWTVRSTTFTTNMSAVHFANGIWVAVGASGLISTSVDPTGLWGRTGVNSTDTLYSVFFSNGIWIAGGTSGGDYFWSTDPAREWIPGKAALGGNFMRGLHADHANNIWAAGNGDDLATGE